MSPARYPSSVSLSRTDSTVRSIVVIAIAAVVGTVVGGLSVLGIVVAVIQPPNRDTAVAARAESGGGPAAMVTTAATPQIAQPLQAAAAPQNPAAVNSAPENAPGAAPAAVAATAPQIAPAGEPPQPVVPVQAQSLGPAQLPAAPGAPLVVQKSWPDGLTARTRRAHESQPAAPNDTQAVAPAEQTGVVAQDVRADTDRHTTRSRRPVTARSGAPAQSAPDQVPPGGGYATRRTVVTGQPAAPPQAGWHDTSSDPPDAGQRPLFDFFGFGHRHYDDNQSNYDRGYNRDNWNDERRD